MILLDTGAFLARYFERDADHAPLFTSNHEMDKTIIFLGRRAGYTFAADTPGIEEEAEAIRWLRRFADQKVSFTDCVSFVLMKRHRIPTAFTFDRHFSRAGFQTLGA